MNTEGISFYLCYNQKVDLYNLLNGLYFCNLKKRDDVVLFLKIIL